MSSAVVPQWKVALQQKLDKKKDDERRKSVEEEQRRLAALPPWKRMGMVPQNVIIISGGTKTVSKLSSDGPAGGSIATTGADKVKSEPVESKSAKSVQNQRSATAVNKNVESNIRTNSVNKSQLSNSVNHANESKLTNHAGHDEIDGQGSGKVTTGTGLNREGVDEEHVSSVFDNPFLKLDTGRRRRVSPVSKPEHLPIPSQNTAEHKTTDTVIVVKRQPDNNIRQRSRSVSPNRAARENNQLKIEEKGVVVPEDRSRKTSVSDLLSRFGQVASVEDLRSVSRKQSQSEEVSPLASPRSPTATLDRSKLFDNDSHKVRINLKPDSAKRPASTSDSTLPSTQIQVQKPSDQSKQSMSKPASVTETKVISATGNGVSTKRQAPKAPTTSETSVSIQKDPTPVKTTATSGATSQNAVQKDVAPNSKPVESSKRESSDSINAIPDQPKTAILGDGQSSSLRRKKASGKISASALISLSNDSSNEVQLSEHNARVRAKRQEARAGSSKNLIRSAKDNESKDTDSIPNGVVSTNAFGSNLKSTENHIASSSKGETQHVDTIPYPTNFRQPKQESTYVDTIPYPENFRQPKSSKSRETSEPKPQSVAPVSTTKSVARDDIPRTNIDEIVLMPIDENVALDTQVTMVNGSVGGKAPSKNIKRTLEVEWIGYNTPTGKPSALKARKTRGEDKGLRITFNESNMSETFEYQSEASLLNEYLREERGINGNPRVGNLPRQEAQVEEDDDDMMDAPGPPSSSSQGSINNVLAHEGLQSYTPKDLQNFSPTSFRQQQQQQQQRDAPKPRDETPSPASEPDRDDIAITYDDTGDYFSSAGSSSAALLF